MAKTRWECCQAFPCVCGMNAGRELPKDEVSKDDEWRDLSSIWRGSARASVPDSSAVQGLLNTIRAMSAAGAAGYYAGSRGSRSSSPPTSCSTGPATTPTGTGATPAASAPVARTMVADYAALVALRSTAGSFAEVLADGTFWVWTTDLSMIRPSTSTMGGSPDGFWIRLT